MDELRTAKEYLSKGKYREAGNILNGLIRKNRDNDELWYFLGVLAVKLRNYDTAHEYLERAISLNKKPEYLWFNGMAFMEELKIEDAIEVFNEVLEIDRENADANFFLSICYLLLDDSRSDFYMKKAYSKDKRKTKQLLRNFFEAFAGRSARPGLKSKIEKQLDSL